ncbi:MAG: flagellar hook-basal body complex protein [Helicobacter sp.]|nr:flagellar hook-basal body complex protein [Helicobacter sp.]
MNGSVLSAYSGIKSHQFGIDAISNNIANVNTNGYRATSPEFKTLMTQHIDSLGQNTISNDTSVGVVASSNAISTKSGVYRPSDGQFDMAYEGKGWFVVGKNANGEYKIIKDAAEANRQNFFTRDGSFTRDGDGYIVNSSGYYVYGIDLGKIKNGTFDGSASEEDDNKALASNDLKPLQIPAEITYKPVATTKLDLTLNLNPEQDSTTLSDYLSPNDSQINLDLLNNLDINALFGYRKTPLNALKNGSFHISLEKDAQDENGYKIPGEKRDFDFKYGLGGAENNEFKTFGELKQLLKDRANLDLDVIKDSADPSKLRFSLKNNDDSRLTINGDIIDELGLNAAGLELKEGQTHDSQPLYIGTYAAKEQFFDENGKKFQVQSKFYLENNDPNNQTWAVKTQVLDLNNNPIGDEQTSSINFQDSKPNAQNLELTLNEQKIAYSIAGTEDKPTSNRIYEESKITNAENDGKEAGQFEDLKVDENGIIHLYFSNGISKPFGRVGIASFVNDQGLVNVGNNMFEMAQRTGPDGQNKILSGAAILGWDEESGHLKYGRVMYKHLEGSNTDVTRALTDLILMQKGYMMASKAFGAGDDLMKEAINLKR